MIPLLTAGLLSVTMVLTAPADDPTEEQPAEEQPAEEQPAEEGVAPEAGPEGEPAAPAEPVGYEATVELTNGSVLRGRVVDENLEGITIVLEGMAGSPVVVARSSIVRVLMGADADVAPPPAVVVEVPVEAPAAAPAEPAPTPAEVGRGIGFGFNFGLGMGFGDTTNLVPNTEGGAGKHFDLELPGFELRLFPDDRFSLDFLFKFGNAAALQQSTGYGGWYYGLSNEVEVVLFSLYWHFHTPSQAIGESSAMNFAIAPGVALGGSRLYGQPWWGQIGASLRLGVDLTSADGVMGFGLYARPGISMLMFNGYSEPSEAGEILLELTWTWYAPRAPNM